MSQVAGDRDASIMQFAGLLDALNCGAALVDRSGRLVHANARLCQMLQRPAAELCGFDLFSLYAGDQEAADSLRQTLAHFEQPREDEFYLPLPNGTRLPVMTSARPLHMGDSPAPARFRLVTIIDISHQKQAEQDIKDQYEIIARLSNTILQQALGLKDYSKLLEQRVRERTAELREANFDTIYMLAVACEAKDQDTGRHVRRIRDYARLLSLEIGLDEHEAEAVAHSAVLHDVGKMHVPDHILKKPGPLNEQERLAIQAHTVMGERILGDKPFFARARRIARAHHENWDGSGYPDGAGRDAIPLEARIVHLADVFDALTTPRVYKSAWSATDAAGVLRESSGKMFDPEIVKAFESLFSRGMLQELKDA